MGQRFWITSVSLNFGMKFHRDGKLQHADRQWSRALWGAVCSLSKLAAEHGVQKRIDLVLKLYQVYAVPMGLYDTYIGSTLFCVRIKCLHRESNPSTQVS